MSSRHTSSATFGVAEAKRRFSELLDRVSAGERVVVHRRGRPAAVLGPASPEAIDAAGPPPLGLAAVAGALSDWDELDATVAEIYEARAAAHDRPVPELE